MSFLFTNLQKEMVCTTGEKTIMKVKDLMMILEKSNPDADIYCDVGNDLDPINKVTAFCETIILNMERD